MKVYMPEITIIEAPLNVTKSGLSERIMIDKSIANTSREYRNGDITDTSPLRVARTIA
jgi:3-deoxy-D-arabino-heptulosonate 7-phosphate (DAHP) synthase